MDREIFIKEVLSENQSAIPTSYLEVNFDKIIHILKTYKYGKNFSEKETIKSLGNRNERDNFFNIANILYKSENFKSLKGATNIPFKNKNKGVINYMEFDSLFLQLRGKVLIKPNFVSAEKYPESSSSKFIKRIISFLEIKNIDLSVGDGPSLFFESKEIISIKRKEIKKVKILNFNNSEFVLLINKKGKILPHIEIPKEILEFDHIINVSNFKEHNSFGYSGSIKNLMGIISPATRIYIHRLNSIDKEKALIELYNFFKPLIFINIVDARKIMYKSQQKIYGGIAKKGFGIFYSNNAVLLDKAVKNKMLSFG